MIRPQPVRFSAPVWGQAGRVCLLAALLIGCGMTSAAQAAKVSRPILKSYFETGDKPTATQFGALIDSLLNISEDRHLLGLKLYDSASTYQVGDTVVYNQVIYTSSSMTFGPYNLDPNPIFLGTGRFLPFTFSDSASPGTHYGYLQLAETGLPDHYPLNIEFLVFEDQPNTALTALPEPASIVLAACGLLGGLAFARRRLRTAK